MDSIFISEILKLISIVAISGFVFVIICEITNKRK